MDARLSHNTATLALFPALLVLLAPPVALADIPHKQTSDTLALALKVSFNSYNLLLHMKTVS